jgi:CRISPR system Cascade subunit CasC
MFVELHMIQNFAPSCLNRDESNVPKDCTFGDVRRARISSQCLKRFIRWHPEFTKLVGHEPSLLTKKTKKEVAGGRPDLRLKGLADLDLERWDDPKVDAALDRFLSEIVLPVAGGETKVQLFLGRDEVERMVARLKEKWSDLLALADQLALERPKNDKKKQKAMDDEAARLTKALTDGLKVRTKATDVALFGRMIAKKPDLEKDAACQVAHAISTHRVDMSDDFYTAVDDLKELTEEQGASMMGHIDFNSSCYYRFAVIETGQLVCNLEGDKCLAKRAIEGFIRASVAAIPSGKQNSFAALNTPCFAMIVVRDGGAPWALHNAFEQPVRVNPYNPSDDEPLSDKSITRLDQYVGRLRAVYGENGQKFAKGCYAGLACLKLENIGLVDSFDCLVTQALEAIKL